MTGLGASSGARMDHDVPAARAVALTATGPSLARDVRRPVVNLLNQLDLAVETGDRTAIARLLPALDASERAELAGPVTMGRTRPYLPTLHNPIRAEAEILLGRLDRAAALLAGAPANCLPCTSARARLAQAQGDVAGTAKAYDAAVKMAPSLPHPLVDRGRFLLAQQRWAAAEADFRAAEKLSNGWADPQKYLGDALAAQGRRADAKAAWAEAVRRAPKWAEAQAALKAAS